MVKSLIHILLACVLALPGLAQTFETTVNRNRVALGERIQVTYSLNANGKQFRGPKFEGFQVLSGPNQSQQTQWINGNMSSSLSYSYVLMPTKTGNLLIPGAQIRSGGKNVTSNPVAIQVVKGNQSKAPKSKKNNQQQISQEIKDNLYIKLQIDKNKAVVGEQITATYKIYTRVDIVDNGINKLPAFNGFFAEEVELSQNDRLQRTTVRGVPFNVATIKKTILIPQRSGKLEIDPLILDVVIRIKDNKKPRSVFDQFFGGFKDVKYQLSSNKATVKVSALPKNGKPLDFNGAVGEFSQAVTLDKDSLLANDAINLKIKYSGTGNIKLINEPAISFPPDFEVYDPKINQKISTKGSSVSGVKTFEYLIIPRHAGVFEIPSIPFSFYNPKKGKYETLKSKPFEVKVGRSGQEESAAVYAPTKKEEVKLLGKDIRFIKEDSAAFNRGKSSFLFSSLFYVLAILPLIGLAIFVWLNNKKGPSKLEIQGRKSKQASRLARKKLKIAKARLDQGDKQGFFEELLIGLNSYFSDKFVIPVSELAIEQIESKLNELNFSEEVVSHTKSIFNKCEMARYAPTQVGSEQEVLKEAESLIHKIEANA